MPRFSLKDLLIASALFGTGTAWLGWLIRIAPDGPFEWWYAFAVSASWFGGGAMVGAGLLAPFKRPWLGAACGAIAQIMIGYLLMVVTDIDVGS